MYGTMHVKPRTSPLSSRRRTARLGRVLGYASLIFALYYLLQARSRLPDPNNISSSSKDEAELGPMDWQNRAICTEGPTQTVIPNIAHFVYLLPSPESDFDLTFSHFLSIYAVWYHWRPDAIYLHTNTHPDSRPIQRARSGLAGRWSRLVFSVLDIKINRVVLPAPALSGASVHKLQHAELFTRIKAVHDMGGTSVAWESHALRDIKDRRKSGFRAVVGGTPGGGLGRDALMSVRCGAFIGRWLQEMQPTSQGDWPETDPRLEAQMAQRLTEVPGEIVVLEPSAFSPCDDSADDRKMLFELHPWDEKDMSIHRGRTLPPPSSNQDSKSDGPAAWERDWSSSYLLNVPRPVRGRNMVGLDQITPRLALERRSNFARAVYPAAWEMYRAGLIDREELYD